MQPAFSSLRQAVGYLLLLLVLLLLPVIVDRLGLLSRPNTYLAMPTATGDAFSYVDRQIFEKKTDLDIVFLGSSRIWADVATPYVQQQLSAQLGREAQVITLGSNMPGDDRNYVMLRDLLLHRKVKMVVLGINTEDFDKVSAARPYVWAYRFFNPGTDEMLPGLPFRSQATLYAEAVLGMPRQLLSLVRSNLVEKSEFSGSLGAHEFQAGFVNRVGGYDLSTFIPYAPPSPQVPVKDMIYSTESQQNFHFSGQAMLPYQKIFDQRIGQLLRQYHVHLVMICLPHISESKDATAEVITNWPAVYGQPVDVVGVPPVRLFGSMSDEDLKKLFYNPGHLNANGDIYFTHVITPALIDIYARIENHS